METKRNKFLEFVVNVVFGLSLVGFFVAFNFSDKMNGWHQQFLPAGITNNINSLVFTDSLTGYIATANDNNGVSYLLKTTNGGDNWFALINDTGGNNYSDLHFFNKDTAYVQRYNQIYKTYNAGLNWSLQCTLPWVSGLFALNLDTIFCLDSQPIIGGFWRTTNGGTSWQMLVNFGSNNPSKVYFYNKNMGFLERSNANQIYKTTDGGFNWFFASSGDFFTMYFLDSLNGFKSDGGIKRTTDGGFNWIAQQNPNIFENGFGYISVLNKDTIWGVGGTAFKDGIYRGVIYKTTNGGVNWGYQIPLNNNSIAVFRHISFANYLNGGSFYIRSTGVHTNVGGSDTTIFTGINTGITHVPKDYVLYQNYPNPFNQSSIIKYQLSIAGAISIKVYDIQGKEIMTLVNERKPAGMYEIKFNGSSLSSGIYFYTLFSEGIRVETRKMTLLK